jgi:hypothetical protein
LSRRSWRRLRSLYEVFENTLPLSFLFLLTEKRSDIRSFSSKRVNWRKYRFMLSTIQTSLLPNSLNTFIETRHLSTKVNPPTSRRLHHVVKNEKSSNHHSEEFSAQRKAEEFIERVYSSATDPNMIHTTMNSQKSTGSHSTTNRNLYINLRRIFGFRGPFALRVSCYTH